MDGTSWIEHSSAARRPGTRLRQLIDLLVLWHDRARQRRQLAAFDDRALRDMGVTRLDALREYEKPFWRP